MNWTILAKPLATMAALAPAFLSPAQAGTYKQVYFFNGGADGQYPIGGLVRASDGTLYGATAGGGTNNLGTVYSISPAGTHTVLYNFSGADGQIPLSTLIMDQSGSLYGTTYSGGAHQLGTIFKLTPQGSSWTETVLYSFSGGSDGALPVGGLIFDGAGNLYGATGFGGSANAGTVFKLTPQGTESVLYQFQGGTQDGAYPLAALSFDASGTLYGVTTGGGAQGLGTVFSLNASAQETVLHSFAGGEDGAYPYYSQLVPDANGNMRGTTMFGGNSDQGVAFKIAPNGKETVFYQYCNGAAPTSPCYPVGGLLSFKGKLYGTGELLSTGAEGEGYGGDLFSLTGKGAYTDLYDFSATFATFSNDGLFPVAGLTVDPTGRGTIWGTTFLGSPNDGGANHGGGFGEVFSFTLK